MGYRDYTAGSRNNLLNTANPLVMLVILQIIFFILLNFIKSIYTFSSMQEEAFYRNIYHWFIMPADLMKFFQRPWTLITMQFSEVRLMIVISNLIWLWTFGFLVQDLIGNDKLFPIYIYSATAAGLVFMLTVNLMYPNETVSFFYNGPAAGTMGLAIAATTISPKYRFFPMIGGGIPLWIITVIYFLLNASALFSKPVMLLPVLAAALMGYLFIRLLNSGNDLGDWMNSMARWMANLYTPGKKKNSSPKQTTFYQQGNQSPFSKKSIVTQQRIDALLDKINQKGYDLLTEEEKKFLREASNEDL
jgi:membrane associated rhomboid family serine protease